jgi:hypothetical protein
VETPAPTTADVDHAEKLAATLSDSAAGSATSAPVKPAKAIAKTRPARNTARVKRPARRSVTATNDDTTEDAPRREPPKLVAPSTPSEDLYDTR